MQDFETESAVKEINKEICERRELLAEEYRRRIEEVETRELIREFLSPNSPVVDLVIVIEWRDLPGIRYSEPLEHGFDKVLGMEMYVPPGTALRRAGTVPPLTAVEIAFGMESHGTVAIVPLPDELGRYPDEWRPYLDPRSRFEAYPKCRVIRDYPVCWVSFAALGDSQQGVK